MQQLACIWCKLWMSYGGVEKISRASSQPRIAHLVRQLLPSGNLVVGLPRNAIVTIEQNYECSTSQRWFLCLAQRRVKGELFWPYPLKLTAIYNWRLVLNKKCTQLSYNMHFLKAALSWRASLGLYTSQEVATNFSTPCKHVANGYDS